MSRLFEAAALRVFVFVALFGCVDSVPAMANSSHPDAPLVRNARLEKIAAGLTTALEIHKQVQVVIVPKNDRVVSWSPS